MITLQNLVARVPGGIAQGIIWGIMALGVYITFRVLKESDLTVDGSFATGGATAVMLITNGTNPWLAMLIAFLVGIIVGCTTGLIHTRLKIPAILSGILVQFALYSINLHIMGMAANKALSVDKYRLLLSSRSIPSAILTSFVIALVLVSVFYWYFGTERGCAIRCTGNNEALARALGISTGKMKIIALSLSNGLVALSGALMSQYQGFADINMGRGSIVIGLAAIILGEALGAALLGKRLNFYGRMAFTVLGGVVYYLVVVVVLWLKLNSNDLKLITAVIVALFLALPYLREKRKSSFRHSRKEGQSHA